MRKAHWHLELTGLDVEAGLVITQQTRFVERTHELVHGLDALNGLMDFVGLGRLGRIQSLGHGERGTVVRNGADLDGLAAQADPEALHGGRKLADRTGHAQAACRHGGRAGGQLRLASGGRPGHGLTVEVQLVDHGRLEGRGQIEHTREGLLNKRQLTQAQGFGVQPLQRLEHLRHGRQHIDQAQLGHLSQLVKILGLDIDTFVARTENIPLEGDQGSQSRLIDQLHTCNRGIQRQLDQHWRSSVLQLELAIDQRQSTFQANGGLTLAPVLAFHIFAAAADAGLDGTQRGADQEVLGGQIPVETEFLDLQLSAIGPIEAEVEIQRRAQIALHSGLAIELQTQSTNLRSQVQTEVHIAFEYPIKAQGNAITTQTE